MPRYNRGKTKVSVAKRTERARRYRVTGLKRWIDPYPKVHGTVPEKMVYAALSRRGIPFYFLNNVHIAIPEIELFKTYQADFIIPSFNLIIEVQGAHWHSKQSAIESDAFKFALYQQAGYRVVAWWDFDILADVNQLFRNDPQLASIAATYDGATELAAVDRTKVDTSKGIRTLNRRRAIRNLYKKPPIRQRRS